MSAEDHEASQRLEGALRKLRWQLNDEQLDALDQLMEHLLSFDADERRQQCEALINQLKGNHRQQEAGKLE
jgi:hypothetical protein